MTTEAKPREEHIGSVRTYLTVGAALFFLTGLTVAMSFVHLGPFNLVVAIGIAALKASLVALIFMHLFYDDKLYLTIFVMAILMLAFFIILTLFDTLHRGDIYQEVAKPYKPEAVIYPEANSETTAAGQDSVASTGSEANANESEQTPQK
ncbi:MAG: cytochrome C oxidase subunit IV family protein [Calditrichota bacterium]